VLDGVNGQLHDPDDQSTEIKILNITTNKSAKLNFRFCCKDWLTKQLQCWESNSSLVIMYTILTLICHTTQHFRLKEMNC